MRRATLFIDPIPGVRIERRIRAKDETDAEAQARAIEAVHRTRGSSFEQALADYLNGS